MPQLSAIRSADEDWTGRANAKEKKKLQNRLNQRLWRMRRGAKVNKSLPKAKKKPSWSSGRSSTSDSHEPESITPSESPTTCTIISQNSNKPSTSDGSKLTAESRLCDLSPTGIRESMAEHERVFRRNYTLGSPRVDQLLTLIQFNVARALLSNIHAMGFAVDWQDYNAISPFYTKPVTFDYPSFPADLWPIPAFRDNLLKNLNTFDEDALCNDLIDFVNVTHEHTGFVVWKDPWDSSGWEVSETFMARWAWTLEGCEELIRTTNFWRRARGEDEVDASKFVGQPRVVEIEQD
ncbi:hypothetical protein K402DRAFT_413184 [Aulographum hederae CBS 113979]|uniref:BZIP domain-containing protein n=1 Tax=Aulographum hederae CBS 113979 TaxID=1176131 RepID=A0A6G1GXR1_9PEZI|nr:hypothetical protein K402DRAFT_413184 [Aulographum hederae CBS 113979]